MDLNFQPPGDHLYVRSISGQGICIADNCYSRSLLLSADELISDWPPQSFAELEVDHLQAIFQLHPELVLVGTGSRQHFASAEIMMEFHQRGIGIEVMGTAAACRTFNVLVYEARPVVAALFPLQAATEASTESSQVSP